MTEQIALGPLACPNMLHKRQQMHGKLEGKYTLESTDPRESEIRAPPQPLPYLMPIPPNTLFYNK